MARRPAETMTEVRIDVSRYAGITEKFREAVQLSGAITYIQVCVSAIDMYPAKLRRDRSLAARRQTRD
ncbi:hypothetical protein SAMN05216374_2328 [Tardiphaga sp. OK246]|jgi:hypothetical protein|uniref:hypothetical protein n=1 Tax=Tardiphaga sp. OK246 TaxID=1855307 RepID=UPI000B64A92C|nr:hypothetical protein [Tardiphaga sp. OK246]SNT01943.1 hypothetical protein SAMN05216374_2328 [Tardiphaga sp. OK246]